MELNYDYLIPLFIWIVAVLALWNLHRYAGFLNRRYFLLSFLIVTLFAAAGIGYIAQTEKTSRPIRTVAVLPVVAVSDERHLTPEGVLLAYHASQMAAAALDSPFSVVPLEWPFEMANLDSVVFPAYWQRLARATGYDFLCLGEYSRHGDLLSLRLTLLEPQRNAERAKADFRVPVDRLPDGAAQIAQWLVGKINGSDRKAPPPEALPPAFYQAYLHLMLRDPKAALPLLRPLYQHSPENRDVIVLLAKAEFADTALVTLEQKKREVRLQDLSERLADLSDGDTTDVELARLAGEGFLWREKFNEAAVYGLRAYRHARCHPKVLNLLARLHFTRYRPLGFFNEVEIYKQALQCNPGDLQALLELAAAYMQLYRTVEAQTLLEKALQINPNHPDILNALGQIYVSRGLTEKIFTTYQKILELQPRNPVAYYNLGIYYYHSGQDSIAQRFFERAVQVGNHRDSRLYLAKIAEKQGRLDDAIEYLRQRIRLKTGEHDVYAEEARRHLFQLMLALGKVDSTGRVLDATVSPNRD